MKAYFKLNEDFDTEVLHDTENSESKDVDAKKPYTKKPRKAKRYATDMYEDGDMCEAVANRVINRLMEGADKSLRDDFAFQKRTQNAKYRFTKYLNQYYDIMHKIDDELESLKRTDPEFAAKLEPSLPPAFNDPQWRNWDPPKQSRSFLNNIGHNLGKLAGRGYEKMDNALAQGAVNTVNGAAGKLKDMGKAAQDNFNWRTNGDNYWNAVNDMGTPGSDNAPINDFERMYMKDAYDSTDPDNMKES